MFSTPFVLTFSLLLSLPILFLLAPRILPPRLSSVPISPSDELEDLSLFRRASATPTTRLPSSFSHLAASKPKLKIAFLFLTNSDLQFAPLWEKFFRPPSAKSLYNIYVHADPTVNVTSPGGVFEGKFIEHAKRTYRASPTLISATRRLLATAILDDPANAFFAVISQHCIPLHSFKFVYHSLLKSRSFDFSSGDPDASTQYGIRLQYKSFIEVISDEPRLWKRYVARGRYAMMPEVPFEDFRVGSQFFVLTRRHALMVIKDRRLWKKFRMPCYREDECYPEEHYFPTLLSMQDPKGCTQYTLTKVNWTGTVNGHPYTYKKSEISPELIQGLRESKYSSSYLFARKFAPDCLAPLLKIADKVIFRD
ncbi:unnamed protein product [Linum tenue]|nr:unnamed protein product [Linum tenue]